MFSHIGVLRMTFLLDATIIIITLTARDKELVMSNTSQMAKEATSLLNASCELLANAKNAPDFANPVIFGIAVLGGLIAAGMTLDYGFEGSFDLEHKKGSIAFRRQEAA